MMRDTHWVEVWIDDAPGSEYLLLLRADATGMCLIDPQKSGECVASFDGYEDASHWLREEEYELVGGRHAGPVHDHQHSIAFRMSAGV